MKVLECKIVIIDYDIDRSDEKYSTTWRICEIQQSCKQKAQRK